MAEKKKLYWIGPGVVTHAGKSYGKDDPLPEGLPQKFLEAQIKAGNIGEKMKVAEIISNDAATEIKALRADKEKLEKENEALKLEVKELKKGEKAKDGK